MALRFSRLCGLVAIRVIAGGGSGIQRSSRLARPWRSPSVDHQRLVNQIRNGLSTGELSLPLPQGFGVQAALVPGVSRGASPTLRLVDGSYWLTSRTPSPSRFKSCLLEVRQNITASIQNQRRDQLLLIAAAGMSLLLVSLLFRLVLWRGLIKPLQSLTLDLSRLSADSRQRTLDPVGQSRELQPIVEAFNQLQARSRHGSGNGVSLTASPELRTPITVISGHAQSLQAELPEASQAKLALTRLKQSVWVIWSV